MIWKLWLVVEVDYKEFCFGDVDILVVYIVWYLIYLLLFYNSIFLREEVGYSDWWY